MARALGLRVERLAPSHAYMVAGSVLSVAAAIAIQYVLVSLAAGAGLESLYKPPLLWALLALIAIGLPVYYSYVKGTIHAYRVMRNVSPLALLLASIGVALGALYDPVAGSASIIAAYVVELVVGAKLYRDYLYYSRPGAKLFLAGVTVFVATLPLVVLNPLAALLPLTANTVKAAGLAAIAYNALRGD